MMNTLFSLFYSNLLGSLDKYFQHLCDDLEVFAAHAGRKTVKLEDLELLMRRSVGGSREIMGVGMLVLILYLYHLLQAGPGH